MLHHDSFWGFEQENYIATSTIGATKGNEVNKNVSRFIRRKKFY